MAEEAGEVGRTMVASALASLASRVACHPIDTLKARRMSLNAGRVFGESVMDVVLRTWRAEGLFGFYRGFGAVAIIGTPAGALYLTTYDVLVKKLAGGEEPSAGLSFVCGVIAEAVACILFVPVDVMKERAQVGTQLKIWEEGIGALYKGYGATMISFGAYSGLYFVFYEYAKKQAMTFFHKKDNTVDFSTALLASLAAGGLASFLTSPLDLAKLRLQVDAKKDLNFFPLLFTVYKTDGLRGLFRGAGARVAFFAPSTAIAMASFETFKTALPNFS